MWGAADHVSQQTKPSAPAVGPCRICGICRIQPDVPRKCIGQI
jgi:hypothetical protein